jgi:putative phosphoribosyl transferase
MINFPDGAESESSQKGDELFKDATPFPDLRSAGRELATRLETFRQSDRLIVVAIVLGGVPVAHEVANHLNAPLDLLIIRRLFAPQGPGSQICAVSVGGSLVIDDDLARRSVSPSTPVDYFMADALAELARREQICRPGRPPIDLAGKKVLLVDCGIRTGSTMQAAIEALRTKGPARIVAAVPVASVGGHATVANMADELVSLVHPRQFGNVGLWYRDFSRPGDDGVGELLRSDPG